VDEETKNTDRELVDSTLDEHRECMQIVGEVETCLDGQPDREGRWMGRLLPQLQNLAAMLRTHFCGEEQTALYQEIPVKNPQYADTLERLVGEHGQILDRVDALVQKAGQIDQTRIHELREFNAGVQLLVASIRRHEAEENEVVLNAYWQEVGAGD
jgi:hypothetical protein